MTDPTLVDLLQRMRADHGSRTAFEFLANGEVVSGAVTYAELDRSARIVAGYLQQCGAAGGRALLLYPPGLEFITAFFGCQYAGVTAVPAYLPRRTRMDERASAIAADCQSELVLTVSAAVAEVRASVLKECSLPLRCVATDTLDDRLADVWRRPPLMSDGIALLQYTSGSTSKPKGVMVTHANLIENLENLDRGWKHDLDSVMVSWLPVFHDMGLIYGTIMPVYKGFRCVTLPPAVFLQSPVKWLQAISTTRATHSGGPNFAYDLCSRRVSAEQRANLDLRSWRVALNGAEPVRWQTLQRFAQLFEPCGFSFRAFAPGYGLAEATLKVTAVPDVEMPIAGAVSADGLQRNRVLDPDGDLPTAQYVVGCGRAESGTRIVIVNPASRTNERPGSVGEIWVSGASVAQGYWNRPDDTFDTFQARLADSGEGPFLRTGDLGFLKDDQLFVTGRIKDLIIIRGRNYYPQDIEATAAQCHEALATARGAAFTIDVSGQDRLVVVHEIGRARRWSFHADEVVIAVCRAIAEQHELQVHAVVLLSPGSLPVTSSGKIQRRACKAKLLSGTLNPLVRWERKISDDGVAGDDDRETPAIAAALASSHDGRQAIESWLIGRLAVKLGLDPGTIRVREPFAQYGLDSAGAVELVSELADWLHCQLSPTLVYDYPTIEVFSRHVAEHVCGSSSCA